MTKIERMANSFPIAGRAAVRTATPCANAPTAPTRIGASAQPRASPHTHRHDHWIHFFDERRKLRGRLSKNHLPAGYFPQLDSSRAEARCPDPGETAILQDPLLLVDGKMGRSRAPLRSPKPSVILSRSLFWTNRDRRLPNPRTMPPGSGHDSNAWAKCQQSSPLKHIQPQLPLN